MDKAEESRELALFTLNQVHSSPSLPHSTTARAAGNMYLKRYAGYMTTGHA